MFSFTPVSATMMHDEKTIITGFTEKSHQWCSIKEVFLKISQNS